MYLHASFLQLYSVCEKMQLLIFQEFENSIISKTRTDSESPSKEYKKNDLYLQNKIKK